MSLVFYPYTLGWMPYEKVYLEKGPVARWPNLQRSEVQSQRLRANGEFGRTGGQHVISWVKWTGIQRKMSLGECNPDTKGMLVLWQWADHSGQVRSCKWISSVQSHGLSFGWSNDSVWSFLTFAAYRRRWPLVRSHCWTKMKRTSKVRFSWLRTRKSSIFALG